MAVRSSRMRCTRVAVAVSFGPVLGMTWMISVLFWAAAGVTATTFGCAFRCATRSAGAVFEAAWLTSATTSRAPLNPAPKCALVRS